MAAPIPAPIPASAPVAAAVVVTTTHDDETKARALADSAVRVRLAACAQISAIHSVYWWDGEVRQGAEWRVDLKTRAELADRLTAFVTEQHDYDTPEVIVVPVLAAAPGYLAWLATETTA
ncbi:divalent-cation tolerance protein CutA [Kitasatospora sp. NBC_01560]|uniref:divalent-cation tolerance protein CutA n=1 Tax=Kitasatospora sp. NBC_01560 TaxID=2975965 RepID=UPI0038651B6F